MGFKILKLLLRVRKRTMACDRVVRWKGVKPTKEQLEQVLRDYIKGAGTVIWSRDRWIVSLPGQGSCPFRSLDATHEMYQKALEPERWFEVWVSNDCMDVITRAADEFTNVVAAGFAELVARFWKTELNS